MVKKVPFSPLAEPEGQKGSADQDRLGCYLCVLRAVERCLERLPNLNRLGRDVVSTIVGSLRADVGALCIVDESTGRQGLVAHYGLPPDSVAALASLDLGSSAVMTQSFEPVVIDTPAVGLPSQLQVSSLVVVPLISRDERIGALLVGCRNKRTWESDELLVLQAVGVRLSGEIDRAHLSSAYQRSQGQLRAMRTLTLSVGGVELDELLKRALSAVLELSKLTTGALLLVREQDGLAHVRAALGSCTELAYSLTPIAPTEGLTGLAVSSGQIQVSENLAEDTRVARDAVRRSGFRSLVCIPLMGRGGVFGTMNLVSHDRLHFDSETLDFLQAMGNQVGIIIENARLYGETKQRLARLTAIQDTALDIVGRLDLSDLLREIVERAVRLLRAKGGGLCLYYPERGELESVVSQGLAAARSGMIFPVGRGVLGRVALTGEPVVGSDHGLYPGLAGEHREGASYAVAAIPLKWGDAVLGVLGLVRDDEERIFDDDEIAMLELLAAHAAIALDNARMYSDVNRQLAESRSLLGIAQAMTTTWNLPDLLGLIAQAAMDLIPNAEVASIHLLNSGRDELILKAGAGRSKSEPIGPGAGNMKVSDGIAGLAVTEGRLINVPDVNEEPRFLRFPESRPLRSLLVAPMMLGSERLGTLSVDSGLVQAFGPNDEQLLTMLSAQASIAISSVRLYEETSRRSEETRRAYQALRMMAETKDEFVARVTHELKAPLAPMRIAVERTLAEAFGSLNNTQRQMLEIALTNVDKLGAVITELLDVVRLGAESAASVGRIFDLRPLAEQGVTAIMPEAEAKEVTLLLKLPDAPVEVNGDQRKIGMVLSNLLGNAVKFNRPGGEVRLCVERKDDEWAQVSVADTGIGIPEKAMDKVFSRFFQVESVSTRVHQGLGLGLAIVKEYVEQGGGEIWVESEEGKGSVFTFTLPLG